MSTEQLPPINDSLVRVTLNDRRKAERRYVDGRRASDRKRDRAVRVRRLIDIGELDECEMEEGYGR